MLNRPIASKVNLVLKIGLENGVFLVLKNNKTKSLSIIWANYTLSPDIKF